MFDNNGFCSQIEQQQNTVLQENTSECIDNSVVENTTTTNQNSIIASTMISQFQKKPSKPVSIINRRRQSLQFPSFHRNLMKRQSEQNLQTNIAENQTKVRLICIFV